MKYIAAIGDEEFTIDIDRSGEITVNGEKFDANVEPALEPTLYSLITGHRSHELRIQPKDGFYLVQVAGEQFEVVVEDERTRRLAGVRGGRQAGSGEAVIKAFMPGVVIDVLVQEGDTVSNGQTLLVLESMKMHNELKAPRDGTVHAVRVAARDKVQLNDILVTIT